MTLSIEEIIYLLEIRTNRVRDFWFTQHNGIIQKLTIKIYGKKRKNFPKLYTTSVKAINIYTNQKYKSKRWSFDLDLDVGGAQAMYLYYNKKGNIYSNPKYAFDYLNTQIQKNKKSLSPTAIKLFNNHPEYMI